MQTRLLLFSGLTIVTAGFFVGADLGGAIGVAYAIVLLTYGFRRIRQLPERAQLPWRLLLSGGAVALLGGVVRSVHSLESGVDFPLPSPADAFVVATYGLLAAAMLMFVHRRRSGRDIDAWIDSVIGSLSIGVVLWVAFLSEYVAGAGPLDERLINTMYFVLSLTLLTVVLRVMAAPGVRTTSYYLLLGAISWLFLLDLVGTIVFANGGSATSIVFMVPFVFSLAISGLMLPSATSLVDMPLDVEPRLGAFRLAGLGAALLLPHLAILMYSSVLPGNHLVSATVTAAGVSLLAMWRMFRLVNARDRVIGQELEIRAAGQKMLQLESVEEMQDRVQVLLAIAAGVPDVHFKLVGADRGADGVADIALDASKLEDRDILPSFPAPLRETVTGWSPVARRRAEEGMAAFVDDNFWFVLPVTIEQSRGYVWVVSPTPLDRARRQAVRSVAREATIALRSFAESKARSEFIAERSLRDAVTRSERRFRSLVQNSSDIIVVIDRDGVINYASPSLHTVLGFDLVDVVGRDVLGMVHPSDQRQCLEALSSLAHGLATSVRNEVRAIGDSGRVHVLELLITDHSENPEIAGYVINARDISEKRELESEIEEAATRDRVTGLPNRTGLQRQLQKAIVEVENAPQQSALILLDIDDFKTLNDGLGHQAGDQVLIEVASRLRQTVRLNDTVARLGGDDFGVVLPRVIGETDVAEMAERLVAAVKAPMKIGASDIRVSVSVGLGLSDACVDADELIRNVDTALHHAKRDPRTSIRSYEAKMSGDVIERLNLKQSLVDAVANDQLYLVYQPIVEISTSSIVGAESLARWRHPERGIVSPGTFIPLAEETGLIVPIGDEILRIACEQLAEWQDRADPSFYLSVNFSVLQLREPDVVDKLKVVLAETGADPRRLVAEVTESVLIDETSVIRKALDLMRDLGIRLAIDDFGTGYSSLGYLKEYRFDTLKIDRSFVSGLTTSGTRNLEVARAIVGLASGLGAKTIAEGIEGAEELDVLRALGCTYGQGFFFHRPMPPGDMERLLPGVAVRA